MRAAGWRTAKSPRCQTSSSGAHDLVPARDHGRVHLGDLANGRLNSAARAAVAEVVVAREEQGHRADRPMAPRRLLPKVGSAPSIGTGFMPPPSATSLSSANTQSMPPLGPLK